MNLEATLQTLATELAHPQTITPAEKQSALSLLTQIEYEALARTDTRAEWERLFAIVAYGGAVPVPKTIPGLAWWLRGDLGVTLTSVTKWADQSGSGDPHRDALATTTDGGTWVPSDPLFGQPTIHLDAVVGQSMTLAGLWNDAPVNQPFTIFIVGRDDAPLNSHRPWIGDANVNEWYQASFGAPPSFTSPLHFGSSAPPPVPLDIEMYSVAENVGQAVIWMTEFNDPNNSTIRINSQTEAHIQFQGTGPGDTGINPLGQLAIGWAFGTGISMQGAIAEIVVFDGILSDADRASMLTYLSHRYSIPVAGPEGAFIDNPRGIAGLRLWLRADLGITAHVTHWSDQSGVGDANRDVANAGPLAGQPLRVPADTTYNSQDALTFTASQFLDMVGLWNTGAIPQPYTLVVVGNDGAVGVENFLGYKTGNVWVMTTEGGFYGIDVAGAFVGTTPDSTTPKILYFEYNDPNTTLRVSELTPERTGTANAGALPALEIGGNTQGQRPLTNGAVAEVLMWPRILTSDEQARLFAYLSSRYAIPVGP